MTIKQKRFCDEYIISQNTKDAAIKAGYRKSTARTKACYFTKIPKIKEYIEQKLEELKNPNIASAAEVLETLTAIMRDEEENTRDRLTAAEKLAKKYSLFTENLENNGKIEVTLSEELDKLAE
jgi:phage terminase small subunit